MTRLAILADLHGNLPALEAVLDDLARFDVDRVVVAGDVINWGPFSAAVVERVANEGWAVLRGNNELYLLDYGTPRAPAEWKDYVMIPWLRRQLNGRGQALIATWPDVLCLRFPDAPPIRVVHGSPRSAWEPIYPLSSEAEIQTMLAGVEAGTLIAGHTHLRMDRRADGRHVLNPGSVSLPLDGVHAASYMLLEGNADGWRPSFRRVPYDPACLFREFERQGFLEACGAVGELVLQEFRTARLKLLPCLNWKKAHFPNEPLTMEQVEAFSRVDPWEYTPPAYHVNR